MNGSKWTVTSFHTTPHMPTYLAAFVICDYEHISRIERGKEVSEGDAPGAGTFVLAAGTPRRQGLHLLGHGPLLLLPPSPVTARSTMLSGAQPFRWGSAEGCLQKGCASRPLRAGSEPLLPGPCYLSEHREKRGRGRTSTLKLRLPVVSLAYMLLVPCWAS